MLYFESVAPTGTTEYISDNACKNCPSGHTCDGIDATACAAPKYVQNNACTDCPSGRTTATAAPRGTRGGGGAEDQAALRGADDARPRDVGARESLRALGERLGVVTLRQHAALAPARGARGRATRRRGAAAVRGALDDAALDEFRGPAPDPLAFGLELVDEADEVAGAPPLPPRAVALLRRRGRRRPATATPRRALSGAAAAALRRRRVRRGRRGPRGLDAGG